MTRTTEGNEVKRPAVTSAAQTKNLVVQCWVLDVQIFDDRKKRSRKSCGHICSTRQYKISENEKNEKKKARCVLEERLRMMMSDAS
jgi:hypothetical protein